MRVDEPFWTESCRAISISEKMDESDYGFCNVITLGSDSEGELYFPEEEEEALPEHYAYQMNLRSGKSLPERQHFKNKEKGRTIETQEGVMRKEPSKSVQLDYNVLAHLRKIPALLSIYDALMMSQELRDVLIYALQNPQDFQAYFAEVNMKEALYALHTEIVTFGQEDLLLGTTQHNRPLYVTGVYTDMKLNRILIDPGSSVNLLTLRTLRNLSLSVKDLNTEKIIIQGFNQHSQKAHGAITLTLQFGDLNSDIKFYVISADPSYKALLGRPWLHQNNIVPSTLHQCLKYLDDGIEKRIEGDIQPFGVHEIAYEDAQYYLQSQPAITSIPKVVGQDEQTPQDKAKVTKDKELTAKPPVPHFGSDTDTDDETGSATCTVLFHDYRESNHHEIYSSEEEETPAITIRQISEISESTLSITKIPPGLYKELPTLRVCQVQELRTFYVPHKVRETQRRKSVQRYILFRQTNIPLTSYEKVTKAPKPDINEMVDITPLRHFSHHAKSFVEKMNFPKSQSRTRHEMFQKLWNPPTRSIVLWEGRTIHTRGLGFRDPTVEWSLESMADLFACNMISNKEGMSNSEDLEVLEPKKAPRGLEDGGASYRG